MKKSDLVAALRAVRIVPVIDPKSRQDCLSMIDTLVASGASVIEITLRTQVAYDTLKEARSAYPDIVLGAGSVMDAGSFDKAIDLGADFTISPGRCTRLEEHVTNRPAIHIPGVLTPSEIIAARQAGQTLLKYYPSEASGGAATLKDLTRIFPDVLVMPSGGIKEEHLQGYAALPGVLAVGGSWMYAKDGRYRTSDDARGVVQRSLGAMRTATRP